MIEEIPVMGTKETLYAKVNKLKNILYEQSGMLKEMADYFGVDMTNSSPKKEDKESKNIFDDISILESEIDLHFKTIKNIKDVL